MTLLNLYLVLHNYWMDLHAVFFITTIYIYIYKPHFFGPIPFQGVERGYPEKCRVEIENSKPIDVNQVLGPQLESVEIV